MAGRPRVYLHIGAMKTGTTYLQQLMAANREPLARAGYLFPGERWIEQDRAARDVLGFTSDDVRLAAQSEGMWSRLVGEMLAHQGKASIFSMEFLSFADTEQATRVVASLSEVDVHVVLTIRDATTVIPAQWQSMCRNGGVVSWGKFVRGLRATLDGEGPVEGRAARALQRTQGVPRMLDVWAPLVGGDHVHVVTVPPRGSPPRLLWERFARVVGVDPGVCAGDADHSNRSLGHPSTELLRRVNVELGEVSRSDYDRVVKGPLARTVLGERARLEHAVTLHEEGRVLAARWNERVRAAVEECGARIEGDLQELPVQRSGPLGPPSPRKPSSEELLAAAATAREGLSALTDQYASRLSRDLGQTQWAERTPSRWRGEGKRVEEAVGQLAVQVRHCIRLLHQLDEQERRRLTPRPAGAEEAVSR